MGFGLGAGDQTKFQEELEREYRRRVRAAFRELLETRHLYQNVRIETGDLRADERNQQPYDNVRGWLAHRFHSLWALKSREGRVLGDARQHERPLIIETPDVRLYCSGPCQRIEPFNAIAVR